MVQVLDATLLPPKTVVALKQMGIVTVEDLCQADPCRVFLLLKRSGLGVTKFVFWQLVALVEEGKKGILSQERQQFWLERLRNYPPVAVFPPQAEMERWMRVALTQAEAAAVKNEVPVGAVVVHQNRMIAAAYNTCISGHYVGRHAEMSAIEQAGQRLNNYRLSDCDLYVTLEPCAMCAGAIIQSRIHRVVYAAREPKTGAAGSMVDLFALKLNAHTAVYGGVLADESQALLQAFFQRRRRHKQNL